MIAGDCFGSNRPGPPGLRGQTNLGGITMVDDREAITRTYADYFRAFQSLDPEAILPYYFVPCLFLSPQGVFVIRDATEALTLFGDMTKGLRARNYGRSEWADLGVKQLSENAAVVSTRVIRYKADAAELERFGATYMLRKTESGWKIVTLTVHDADAVLELA
jgi:ketosteroid isomerase-like protein